MQTPVKMFLTKLNVQDYNNIIIKGFTIRCVRVYAIETVFTGTWRTPPNEIGDLIYIIYIIFISIIKIKTGVRGRSPRGKKQCLFESLHDLLRSESCLGSVKSATHGSTTTGLL